jgi:hypothetical protein
MVNPATVTRVMMKRARTAHATIVSVARSHSQCGTLPCFSVSRHLSGPCYSSTAYACQVPGTPLSSCAPLSVNESWEPATASLTV